MANKQKSELFWTTSIPYGLKLATDRLRELNTESADEVMLLPEVTERLDKLIDARTNAIVRNNPREAAHVPPYC